MSIALKSCLKTNTLALKVEVRYNGLSSREPHKLWLPLECIVFIIPFSEEQQISRRVLIEILSAKSVNDSNLFWWRAKLHN